MIMDSDSESDGCSSRGLATEAEDHPAFNPSGGLAWVAAPSPRHLDRDLEPLQLPLSTSAPTEAIHCTPANLLPSALRKDHPELNFPVHAKRRRILSKSPNTEEIGVVLHRLQNDSSASVQPWTPTWRYRRHGFFEYVQDMKTALGQHKKDVLNLAREHWNAADAQTRDAWGFIRYLRCQLYSTAVTMGCLNTRSRIPLPAGVPRNCPGSKYYCTYSRHLYCSLPERS